jgi:DNA-binding response OmpR family regulator
MREQDRVLVVEDDEAARETLGAALTQSGYTVEMAGDAPEALERLAAFPADLVVSDVNLPGMSGIELVKAIRRSGLRQPVLLMTGAERVGADAARNCGAAGCLRKPMTLDELVWAIEIALACRRGPAKAQPFAARSLQVLAPH